MNYEEIPKYVKRKKSSVSKSKEKSKHRHEYIDCLLIENGRKPYKATYCSICGKIANVNFFELEEINDVTFIMLEDREIFEKYKNLKQIHINNIFQKNISDN